MAAISQTIYSAAFSWMKSFCIVIKISLKFAPKCPIDNKPALVSSIGLDNGLAPNRREAIIWTNTDPVHWQWSKDHLLTALLTHRDGNPAMTT